MKSEDDCFFWQESGRKVMTNLDSLLKSRDITLLTKVHVVKATIFPVLIYSCESWTIKKAEHQRIDAFKLLCWRRLRESLGQQGDKTSWLKESNQLIKGNQSWIFIGRTDTEAEAPLIWSPDANSRLIEKVSEVGKNWGQKGEEGIRGSDGWIALLIQ